MPIDKVYRVADNVSIVKTELQVNDLSLWLNKLSRNAADDLLKRRDEELDEAIDEYRSEGRTADEIKLGCGCVSRLESEIDCGETYTQRRWVRDCTTHEEAEELLR